MRNEIDFAESAKELCRLFPRIKTEFDIMQQVIHLHREFKLQNSIGDVKRKTRLQIFSESFFEPKSASQISKAVNIPRQKIRGPIKSINKLNPLIAEFNNLPRPRFMVKSRDTAENRNTRCFDNPFYRVCFVFRNKKFHSDSNDFLYDAGLETFINMKNFDEHKNVNKLKNYFFNSLKNPGVLYVFLKNWFYENRWHYYLYNAFWNHKGFLKDPITYFEAFEFETIQGKQKTEFLNQFLKDIYHWRNPFLWGDLGDLVKSRNKAEKSWEKIEQYLLKKKQLKESETWAYREHHD